MHRNEMIALLDREMVHDHFRETGQHATRRQLVKSYLVEANAPDSLNEGGGLSEFLGSLDLAVPVQVQAGDDPTIHRVSIGNRQTEFFLDTLDPRFWIAHSVAPAADADTSIKSLVQKTPMLDSVWLPTQKFEAWAEESGVPRVMTAKFAVNTGLYREAISDEEFQDDSLYFKVGSTSSVMGRWRAYQQVQELARSQALWSARVHARGAREDSEQVAIDEVTAAGKVTARGNSFRLHEAVLLVFLRNYKEMILEWEDRFRLDWAAAGRGVRATGEVARISWPEPLSGEELDVLMGQLFSGGGPYRLYGLPTRHGGQRVTASAVDLHTGDGLDLEILPTKMWVYLRRRACGNVLARLLTNLQHFHDARTILDE